jgi:hypothetical protein
MRRQVVNRTLLALLAVLFAFWAAGMLFGALDNAIKHPELTFSGCRTCAHQK